MAPIIFRVKLSVLTHEFMAVPDLPEDLHFCSVPIVAQLTQPEAVSLSCSLYLKRETAPKPSLLSGPHLLLAGLAYIYDFICILGPPP